MPRLLSFYLASITLLLLPVYVVRFKIFGLPSTALEVLILATTLVRLLELILSGNGVMSIWRRIQNPLLLYGLALVVVALLEALVSGDRLAGLGLWRAYFLEPYLFSLVIIDLAREGKSIRWFWVSLVGSGVWLAAVGLAQTQLGMFKDITADAIREVSYGRAVAVYNSGNALALYLGPLAALAAVLGMRWHKIFWAAGVILVAGLLATKSDGGLVAILFVAEFFLMGAIWPKLSGKLRLLFWSGLPYLIALTGAGLLLFFVSISSFTPSVRPTVGRLYNDTKVLRLCLWEGTHSIISRNPWTGSGLGGFPQAYSANLTCDRELLQYPHNIFLNFWVELGLVGLTIYLFIQVKIFQLLREAKDRILALGLAAAFVYLLIHGLVDVPYFKNDLAVEFWSLATLAVLVKENLFTDNT